MGYKPAHTRSPLTMSLPLMPMSTPLLTTTPRLTLPRTRRGTVTPPPDHTVLPFPTAAPRLSPTVSLMPMVDTSLTSATRVLPSTPRPSPTTQPLPQLTSQLMLKDENWMTMFKETYLYLCLIYILTKI